MAFVPAGNWTTLFAVLAGAALLASLLVALAFVLAGTRLLHAVPQRALGASLATQAMAALPVLLVFDPPRDGLRLYAFLLAPIALAHLLVLPFLRKKT